jgi:anthranilate synthase component 1
VTTVLRSTDEDLLALHERFPDRYPVLLESAGGSASLGRLDLLLALPGERLTQLPDGRLETRGIPAPSPTRFLDALDEWWRHERAVAVATPAHGTFCPGWFLYLGYELAQDIEPTLRLPTPRLPRALAWRMRGAVLRDRDTGDTRCIAEDGSGDALARRVAEDLRSVHEARSRGVAAPVSVQGGAIEQEPAVFVAGVRKALEAIARGDIYQANLSRPWRAQLAPGIHAADLYRALRRANPAPFAGLAQLGEFAVLSSSPERLLRLERGIASTRPIAGTRPRGRDARMDDSLRRELQLNEKERAEHVMLVDLERNDLGRICRAGTVQVDEYMTIESYATVHHIVSNVRGELRDDVTPGQAIAAVFPGGTITGCPKVRCMQLLADFEREPRDAYTGSMGYLGLDGTLDLNILIRTLVVRGPQIEFRTGAGIVADSDPEAELAETRAKARGLLRALGGDA